MSKKAYIILIFLLPFIMEAQIYQPTNYPTTYFYEPEILEGNLTNISFAFSMRKLLINYRGPIIKLRRASDNAERDFYSAATSGIVDTYAINNWRGTSNVFITIWYDQSGLGRNAVQPAINEQPQFFPDIDRPYFEGDGLNDNLDINTATTILTNNGANGTVLCAAFATQKTQYSFGVATGSNRWASHVNWSDNNVYFDPGNISGIRSYPNAVNLNKWRQYSFLRTTNTAITRLNGLQKYSTTFSGSYSGLLNFSLLAANGENSLFSTNRYCEFIMYNTNIPSVTFTAIEADMINFWKLNL